MLGNEADAVDAAQDALLSAVRSITRFDGRSSFGTWLYRIATNACLDELRRRRRRPVVGLPGEVDRDWEGAGGSGIAYGPGPKDPADEAIAHVDVDVALRALAPEHRVALVLRDLCDLTYDEIALILDVPIGTVRSRIARGRAALADLMTGQPGPDDPRSNDPGSDDPRSNDPGSGDLGSGAPKGPGDGNATGTPDVQPGKRTGRRAP
jgi:RNA polymerase sigma-70 factor (ECF subfamily)